MQQVAEGMGEAGRVGWDESASIGAEQLGAGSDVGRHDGSPESHGLDNRPAEALGRQAGEDEDVRGGQDAGNIAPKPGDVDPVP